MLELIFLETVFLFFEVEAFLADGLVVDLVVTFVFEDTVLEEVFFDLEVLFKCKFLRSLLFFSFYLLLL